MPHNVNKYNKSRELLSDLLKGKLGEDEVQVLLTEILASDEAYRKLLAAEEELLSEIASKDRLPRSLASAASRLARLPDFENRLALNRLLDQVATDSLQAEAHSQRPASPTIVETQSRALHSQQSTQWITRGVTLAAITITIAIAIAIALASLLPTSRSSPPLSFTASLTFSASRAESTPIFRIPSEYQSVEFILEVPPDTSHSHLRMELRHELRGVLIKRNVSPDSPSEPAPKVCVVIPRRSLESGFYSILLSAPSTSDDGTMIAFYEFGIEISKQID